jgi:hypothetical protein
MKKLPSKFERNWPNLFFSTAQSCPFGRQRRIHMPTNMQGLKIPTGYSLKVSIQNKNKNVEINLFD